MYHPACGIACAVWVVSYLMNDNEALLIYLSKNTIFTPIEGYILSILAFAVFIWAFQHEFPVIANTI